VENNTLLKRKQIAHKFCQTADALLLLYFVQTAMLVCTHKLPRWYFWTVTSVSILKATSRVELLDRTSVQYLTYGLTNLPY